MSPVFPNWIKNSGYAINRYPSVPEIQSISRPCAHGWNHNYARPHSFANLMNRPHDTLLQRRGVTQGSSQYRCNFHPRIVDYAGQGVFHLIHRRAWQYSAIYGRPRSLRQSIFCMARLKLRGNTGRSEQSAIVIFQKCDTFLIRKVLQ